MQGFSFGSPKDNSMHKNVKYDLDFIPQKVHTVNFLSMFHVKLPKAVQTKSAFQRGWDLFGFFLSTTWSISSVNEIVQTERKFLNPEPLKYNTNLPHWYKSVLRELQNQTQIVFA